MTTKIHALLIGINHYLPNRFYRSLQGCVRDINLVDGYLQTVLKIPSADIHRLTAPNPEETVLSSVREGDRDLEPTYNNIVQAFAQLTQVAQLGEQVYIHYCGHGGRVVTQYPELKGNGQTDEGLVPSDIGTAERYVRDVEMTTLLKRMTDKGLVVTMVLDSCHSGGATRGDCAIRGGSEIDDHLSSTESGVAPREELMDNWRLLTGAETESGMGAGSPLETTASWLSPSSHHSARGYVLLAACRPSESAYEYAVNGRDHHGALTYWMIDSLNTLGTNISFKILHDRVCAKIQSRFAAQLPMLLGQADRLLFDSDVFVSQYAATVLDVDGDRHQVLLTAGLPQGMSRGVQFAIYPLGSTDFKDKTQRLAVVEVTEVEAAKSIARLVAEDGEISVQAADSTMALIEQGAPAVVLSASADLVRRVKLYDQKQVGDAENELPPAIAQKQTEAVAAVRAAIAHNGWIVEVSDDTPEGHYQVSVGRQGEYEICTGMPITNLTPALMSDDPAAPAQLVNRLVHLAKYQAVQELDNSDSDLAEALEVQLLDSEKQPIAQTGEIALKNGENVYLRLHNRSERQMLNIAVLDLEPTWEISQLPLKGLDAAFYELAPNETLDTRLSFQVPDKASYQQAKETLKVFATRGFADFRWLRLPLLDQQIQPRSAQRGLSNPFAKLLETIGGDPAQAPTTTRAIVLAPDPNAEWTTKQLQLVVKALF